MNGNPFGGTCAISDIKCLCYNRYSQSALLRGGIVTDHQEVNNEQELLEVARRKMTNLRRQFVIQGNEADFRLLEEMRFTVAQIHRSKTALRQWGIPIQDS